MAFVKFFLSVFIFIPALTYAQTELNEKVTYSIRSDVSLLLNLENTRRSATLNDTDKYIYGIGIVNGLKLGNSELGIGVGIERWKEPVFTSYLSYLHTFDFSYMPWLCVRFNGGMAFGNMNPDEPYPENQSNQSWFFSFSPLARVKISDSGLLFFGIQYELQKNILPGNNSRENFSPSNFLGLSGGVGFH